MPVILKPDDYEMWLEPGVIDAALVADCLQLFDPRLMRKYPASTRVNHTVTEDQECARSSHRECRTEIVLKLTGRAFVRPNRTPPVWRSPRDLPGQRNHQVERDTRRYVADRPVVSLGTMERRAKAI